MLESSESPWNWHPQPLVSSQNNKTEAIYPGIIEEIRSTNKDLKDTGVGALAIPYSMYLFTPTKTRWFFMTVYLTESLKCGYSDRCGVFTVMDLQNIWHLGLWLLVWGMHYS